MDTTPNGPLHNTTPTNYLEAFYLLLWHQGQCPPTSGQQTQFRIKIPSTVFIKGESPYNWFFSNSENILKRKKRENLNMQEIYKEFCYNRLDTDIVAAR
jgi:hypothetical protein